MAGKERYARGLSMHEKKPMVYGGYLNGIRRLWWKVASQGHSQLGQHMPPQPESQLPVSRGTDDPCHIYQR